MGALLLSQVRNVAPMMLPSLVKPPLHSSRHRLSAFRSPLAPVAEPSLALEER